MGTHREVTMYEVSYKSRANYQAIVPLMLIILVLIDFIIVTTLPKFAESNSELSSALAADSDKSRGIFWECVLSSKYEFSCYYLEESIFEIEMAYLFMRLMSCSACLLVFLSMLC